MFQAVKRAQFKLRLADRVQDGQVRQSMQCQVFEDFIFTFDPFQARTLPVFESIYRYGRGMIS